MKSTATENFKIKLMQLKSTNFKLASTKHITGFKDPENDKVLASRTKIISTAMSSSLAEK